MQANTRKKITGDAYRHRRKKWLYTKKFIRKMYPLMLIGFSDMDKKLTDIQVLNLMMKANVELLFGMSPRFHLNFSKMVVSLGSLAVPFDTSVRYISPRLVEVRWKNEELDLAAKKTFYVFKYNATKKAAHIWSIQDYEELEGMDIKFPEEEYGDEVHFWLSIAQTDRKLRSNSVYVGQILPLSN